MKFIINKTNKIDMHIHTNYSSGKENIEEILERAKEQGLKYIAITDNIDLARLECKKSEILEKYGVIINTLAVETIDC